MITTAAVAMLMTSAQPAQTTPVEPNTEAATLASDSLTQGRTISAIAKLEKQVARAPQDPALLINLGIAHAQQGDAEKAQALFERALVSPEPLDLETADGDLIDSRRLARKAMRMLARGEFTPRLTRRD
ncbi:MAG: tetratricopeptide repeat protein [Erythrobacter sp.]|uniref:tetratricopeptide repeat protein n=1 Tax=Erythrobacter sp. TaxID=1042 RepID=UPI002638925A|nr:tetratricopeptide repeat protein [Erythrobacter sp.]MDJ0978602.1 tetratricopeptide repeat protein [Erythrobacter sp.]